VPRRIDPKHIDPTAAVMILARCVPRDGCLEWTGYRNKDGYGVVAVRSPEDRRWRSMYVHRVMFYAAYGFLPSGNRDVLDHLCRNPACCNADHLQAVGTLENTLRGERLSDTCAHGHPWTEENTYWSKPRSYRNPQRMCRTCDRLRKRRDGDKRKPRG
jgi:hypothetical protein